MKNIALLFFASLIIFCSCETKDNSSGQSQTNEVNPAAADFDKANSDTEAIAIADKVMLAMGGRHSYDTTRYVSWNFFGSRSLWWDKHTGDVRIESHKDNFKVKMNIHSMEGEILKDSKLMTHPDSLSKYLERGKNIWINDSYWLVMPFKLKDSGVTLTHAGEEKSDTLQADILEMKFKGVGVTPNNKYQVFVDKNDRLIKRWSFYKNSDDTTAQFVTPWVDYKSYGDILLSGNRGSYKLTDIRVGDELADELNAGLE